MYVTSRAQVTQNNKFAISLYYIKKEASNEVDFLHRDKNESFLQMDTMIFDGGWSSIPNVPEVPNSKFVMSLQYL